MGAKSSKSTSSQNKKNLKNKTHIQTDITCPACNQVYQKGSSFDSVRTHLAVCLDIAGQQDIIENPINDFIIGAQKINQIKEKTVKEYLYQKIPQNLEKTKFKWIKKPLLQLDYSKIIGLTPQQIKNVSFQEKNYWFRQHLEKKRISWTQGADTMKIQKDNVLISSLIEYKKVLMYKEVKIQFVGDKVNDAGGLLRQWIHMVIKEIFHPETGVFTLANTDQVMYKFKWDNQLDEQYSSQLITLFGVIIGKAIFQKIPILSYFDRTILRKITGNQIILQDIEGFDKGLYQSWKFLLENQINDMGLETYFTMNKSSQSSTMMEIQLIQNGSEVQVNDLNKQLYVNSCINYSCVQAVSKSLKCLKNGINQVIPENLLSVFQPYELEMILYGVPYIDVNEWKQNTEYKGKYNEKYKVIQWFWEVMQSFDQEKLANLLHFCTGSSRTPIQGFRFLESNRGNHGKFLIQESIYDKMNPYPKGHTCFNRLQLPHYPSKQLLQTYLQAVASNHLDGLFGLD